MRVCFHIFSVRGYGTITWREDQGELPFPLGSGHKKPLCLGSASTIGDTSEFGEADPGDERQASPT